MKVEFTRDVFNAGTKVFETGKQYEGDLARYVRRGDAVELKTGTETQATTKQTAKSTGAAKGTKGKGKK